MKKNRVVLLISAFACAGVLLGCANAQNSATGTDASASTSGNPNVSSSSGATSGNVIASLTAKSASIDMRIDESYAIASYYTINPISGSLTTKEKVCTYVSSDPTVVLVSGKIMKALKEGSATLTVTSSVDTTKSCSFVITVKDVVFDRALSTYSAEDDFSHEMPSDGGYVETSSSVTGFLYFKNVNAVKWMASASFSIHGVATSEDFPKVGIGTNTFSEGGLGTNQVYFHLNAENPHASATPKFAKIGVVEVANGSEWAWNPTVNDATARHKDEAYTLATPVSFDVDLRFTVIRDSFKFHLFINDSYAFSIETLHDLFGVDGVAQKSCPSLFEFNSDVKFSNYSATADETLINAKLSAITAENDVTTWDVDAQ